MNTPNESEQQQPAPAVEGKPKYEIPLALPDPPYVYVAVNKDRHKISTIDIYRMFVLHEYPTKEALAEMQKQADEDVSIVEPVDVVEAFPQIYDDYHDEISEMYMRMLN